jgi:hypothetical protein
MTEKGWGQAESESRRKIESQARIAIRTMACPGQLSLLLGYALSGCPWSSTQISCTGWECWLPGTPHLWTLPLGLEGNWQPVNCEMTPPCCAAYFLGCIPGLPAWSSQTSCEVYPCLAPSLPCSYSLSILLRDCLSINQVSLYLSLFVEETRFKTISPPAHP